MNEDNQKLPEREVADQSHSARRKVELGVLVTIILALVSFAFWLGTLESRVKLLERPFESIKGQLDSYATELRAGMAGGPIGPQGPPGPSGTPVGTIVPFGGSKDTIPSDWRICNGDHLQVSDFPELYAVIGTNWGGTPDVFFQLPDLNGAFLRGVDFEGLIDVDRKARGIHGKVGTRQDFATAMPRNRFVTQSAGEHAHQFVDGISTSGNWQSGGSNKTGGESGSRNRSTNRAGAHTHQVTGGDQETRPYNMAVLFIIRVR